MSAEKILIIEDQPENIGVLFNFLERYDYDILVATDGHSGLTIALEKIPDLILLDVMMPGMDGFETCRQLKQEPTVQHIPIIFMTALTEVESKITAFEAGGVDYVTKPFQQQELLMRIRTHLSLHQLQQQLQQNNQILTERNAQLDAFAHTVAHDLKNPLNAIVGNSELLEYDCESGDMASLKESTAAIRKAAYKASDIIESLLLLAGTSRHKQLYIHSFDMNYVINKVKDRLSFTLEEHSGTLTIPQQWPFVAGFPAWVEEIWINYITNAFKYGGNPPVVELGMDEAEDHVRFWVRDNGPGLSETQQAQLFVPFTRLHTDRADGHGLGLSIVQSIVTHLGGQAGVESLLGQGSTFYFTLLRQPPLTN
ncbi:MAG: hybrid sensor histidine kinase/response regulator [Pseudomonadota bacterium]|nr:hybrid sensor histidine kinase/response regulator [Pseudomonadota bacterium]